MRKLFKNIKPSSVLLSLFGSTLLAFGLYNVHSLSGVTEGGVLGLILFLDHWFEISPAASGMILNLIFYGIGWKLLGREFIVYSMISTGGFSLSYKIFEQFDPLWPQLAEMPLAAAVIGALFVGVSAGICVRIGGAPSGDDALAMSLSKAAHIKIERVYLLSDLIVLALSLSYIPLNRIMYSLLTVILSGQVIGIVQRIGKKEHQQTPSEEFIEIS